MNFLSRKFFAISSLFLFFVACGEDSTESKVESIEKKYETLADLPACSDEINLMVAAVGSEHYFCENKVWEKIEGYVKNVCNLQLCDVSLEGRYFYTSESRNVFYCKTGTWKSLNGANIADVDFLTCALKLLVKDTVSEIKSLKSCGKSQDGNMAKVANDIYACSNKEWVKLYDEVITEENLPKCSKDGQYVFVLSKMSAYLCKNGEWSKDGFVVDVKSSTAEPRSSSSAPKSSASKSKSADSKSSSSKVKMPESSSDDLAVESSSAPWTDDTTKVRGMCVPSKNDVAKGEEIRWKFINMGGTPVSFEWKFSSNNPVEFSNNMGPTINYTHGGFYRASLVLNKGLASESDEIVCSNLNVIGDVPISGCACTSTAEPGAASESKLYSGEWKVTGCEGGEPFSYEWGNDASGEDSVAVSATAKQGDYAPTVTVYNDDGVSMSPTCPTVYTYEPFKMNCNLNDFSANIKVSNYPKGQYGIPVFERVTLEYILDGGERTPITLVYGSGSVSLNSDYRVYDKFHEMAVFDDGDTACFVFTHLSCSANRSSVQKGEDISWSLSSLQGFDVKSVAWTFTDEQGNTTFSKENNPVNSFQNFGTVRATALINEGSLYEHSVSCSAKIDYPPITGCECGEPELVSETNDLALLEEVRYKWTVTGCTTAEDAGELAYEWDGKYTKEPKPEEITAPSLDETPMNSEIFVFSDVGSYEVYVDVFNEYGTKERVTCPVAKVRNSEIESSSSEAEDSSSSVEVVIAEDDQIGNIEIEDEIDPTDDSQSSSSSVDLNEIVESSSGSDVIENSFSSDDGEI